MSLVLLLLLLLLLLVLLLGTPLRGNAKSVQSVGSYYGRTTAHGRLNTVVYLIRRRETHRPVGKTDSESLRAD